MDLLVAEPIELNAVGTPVSVHPLEQEDGRELLQDGQSRLNLMQEPGQQKIPDGSAMEKDDVQRRVLTPPTSDDTGKREELESSDLSDVEMHDEPEPAPVPVPAVEDEDEDIGEIEPAEYWDGGRIPIFRPVS
jgi:hypothetical protein